MTGTEIIDRIAAELNDTSHNRWTRDDLADFVTWAQDWIVSLRPDALTAAETVTPNSGAEQSLSSVSSNAWRLIQGLRNASGRTIINIDKGELDRILPNDWLEMSTGEPYYLAIDRFDHDRFWLWPPSDGTDIQILVTKNPTDVTTNNEGNDLDLADHYREPLSDYAVALALRRNTDTFSLETAATFQQRAAQLVGSTLPMPDQQSRQREQ